MKALPKIKSCSTCWKSFDVNQWLLLQTAETNDPNVSWRVCTCGTPLAVSIDVVRDASRQAPQSNMHCILTDNGKTLLVLWMNGGPDSESFHGHALNVQMLREALDVVSTSEKSDVEP